MLTQPAGTGADALANGAPAPAATVGAQPGSTPTPAAADAVGTTDRLAYLEAELKKVIGQRDEAKHKALDLPEVKAALATRDEALKKVQEFEAVHRKAEDDAAAKRGEYEKLYQAEQVKAKDLEGKRAETVRTHRLARAQDALDAAYTAAGGLDQELFQPLAAKAIADGSVGVDANGRVTGIEELVAKVRTSKPFLFKLGGANPGAAGAGVSGTPPMDLLKPGSLQGASLLRGQIAPADAIRAAVEAQRKARPI